MPAIALTPVLIARASNCGHRRLRVSAEQVEAPHALCGCCPYPGTNCFGPQITHSQHSRPCYRELKGFMGRNSADKNWTKKGKQDKGSKPWDYWHGSWSSAWDRKAANATSSGSGNGKGSPNTSDGGWQRECDEGDRRWWSLGGRRCGHGTFPSRVPTCSSESSQQQPKVGSQEPENVDREAEEDWALARIREPFEGDLLRADEGLSGEHETPGPGHREYVEAEEGCPAAGSGVGRVEMCMCQRPPL